MASVIQFLNTHNPEIKWGLQIFQLAACHVLIYAAVKKQLHPEERDDTVGPLSRAAYGAAMASFVCTALTTPLVASRMGWAAHKIFSDEFLLRWLGPNGTFAENWKHPRHVVSVTGAILAIPAAIRCLLGRTPQSYYYRGIQATACISLITGRPGLHVLNALAGRIFKRSS